ncbi:hypothetical protein B0T10DRAFT_59916 [Thelonectria olida]|uniref:Uncharacterized protein n=1 Tax=Thelonectria olida TaxID=1576542 RepID=A0A9P8W2W9_9HYPO|nr:hypothetical protein B0T10DRAFT_59916 [Thelonectria olida]
MAIRESIRRALRRSDMSDSSQSEATSPVNSTTSTSKTSISSKSSGSRLTRTWTWGSNKEQIQQAKEQRKSKSKPKRRIVHPSERPLTEQNLRHQEMLSQFTWTFGASSPEQVEDDGFIGISPCCTRAPSLADYDPNTDSDRSSSS